jgi:hypothetical protein
MNYFLYHCLQKKHNNIMANKNPAGRQKTAQAGTKEGEERATFIVRSDLLEDVKSISYWDRQLLKETIDAALTEYTQKWTKKNGAIKPRPGEVKTRDGKRSNSGRPVKEK